MEEEDKVEEERTKVCGLVKVTKARPEEISGMERPVREENLITISPTLNLSEILSLSSDEVDDDEGEEEKEEEEEDEKDEDEKEEDEEEEDEEEKKEDRIPEEGFSEDEETEEHELVDDFSLSVISSSIPEGLEERGGNGARITSCICCLPPTTRAEEGKMLRSTSERPFCMNKDQWNCQFLFRVY